jgi:chromosomal replication initiator protein
MTFPPEVWNGVLCRLRERVPSLSFESWLEPIVPKAMDEGIELLCPTPFHRDRVRDCFLPLVATCVCEETGASVAIRVGVAEAGDLSSRQDPKSDTECDAASVPSGDPGVPSVHGLAPAGVPALLSQSESAAPVGMARMTEVDGKATLPIAACVPFPAAASSARRGSTPVRSRKMEATSLDRVLSETLQITGPAGVAHKPHAKVAAPTPTTTVTTVTTASPITTTPALTAASPIKTTRPEAARRRPPENRRGAQQPRGQFSFPLTFDGFTVGPCNALAKEAAVAMSNGNQVALNQLYLISSPGLGKTHLSRAVIADTVQAQGLRARYATSDSFTTEFTHALRNGRMTDFKRKYRAQCDLLVLEDVQFLAGKSATQLEFFHTVQHLVDCGKRVLLTGDRYPDELTDLDARMRARIASGFVAEINAPDEEVRRNIVRAKAAHGGIRIPDECISLLVDRIKGNVRELEGALIQLVTTASLFKKPIDLALTRDSLQSRTRRKEEKQENLARPEDIIKAVAVFFKTTPEALASRSRRRDVLHPRQLAMYLCRRYTDASMVDIGRALERDHPSVTNAVRKVERELLEKAQLRYQVEALVDRLDELGYRPSRSSGV